MSTSENDVRYRALKIAEQQNVSFERALDLAAAELKGQELKLKDARKRVFAEKGKKLLERSKKIKNKNKRTQYKMSPSSSTVSGGAWGSGKWN